MTDHRQLQPLPLGSARWIDGFWRERFATLRDATLPAMATLMTDTERHRFLGNFFVAAGREAGRHRGPKWDDGDFYKFLEGVSAVHALAPDPSLERLLDDAIAAVAAAQRADGYIHTATQIRQLTDPSARELENPMDFEMYNLGHLMSAGCAHHRATGKRTLLQLAERAADFIDRAFAQPTPAQARHGICPSHLVGLIDLARLTDQPRYAQAADRLLRMRDLVERGDDDNQDRIPFRRQRTAHGHAVRATYLYAGAADVYAATGDPDLLETLRPIWRDMVSRKLYITGGCGALFDGASPDGATDQTVITRVHQAFGRDFQLPNAVAHNETCAAIGNLMFNWRMYLLTGDARHVDLVEHTLINSVLAGMGLDGRSFFYTNTLRQLNPMPVADLRWPRRRQPTLGTFCCPPNVLRTLARSPELAWAVSERAVWTGVYGAGRAMMTIPGVGEVTLTTETAYPWHGQIDVRVEAAPASAPAWSLRLRVPGWCADFARDAEAAAVALEVNGRPVSTKPAGGFIDLTCPWRAGDRLRLSLPMPPRLLEAHPFVEETRNHLAVARGPVVYCVESPDLPPGVRVLDVHLRRGARFDVESIDDGPLRGFARLRTRDAVAIPCGDWHDALYRPARPPVATHRPLELSLIPYFAWDNRGESEMTVWLPAV